MTGTAAQKFQQSIENYENEVYGADAHPPLKTLLTALDVVGTSLAKGGLAESGTAQSTCDYWYTRFASAITAYVIDERTKFTLDDLREVCRRKQSITYIFSASGYRGMSHLIALMSKQEVDGRKTVAADRVGVLLGLIGIDSLTETLLELALKQKPEVLFILAMGWLNQRAVLTAQGEKNRTQLLASGPSFESFEITSKDIPQVVNAWMYCSYASSPEKHHIKDAYNAQLSNLLSRGNVAVNCKVFQPCAKPRMVVIHERFRKQHAMFRCYLPIIQQLRGFFELIAVADEETIDDAANDLFDDVIRLPKARPSVGDIAKQVEALQPDMIYYPSLGMSHWVVLLANLRLAPVQIMTHGHPATSRLKTIDYVYTFHMEGDTGKIHTETHINGPREVDFAQHSDAPDELPALVPPSDREVRIAVNAKVMKLSHRLIEICNEVTKRAVFPVKFTFFPGERGLYFDGLEPAIRARVPNATVRPYMQYRPFLQEISRCDLAFAAFPFGNTNSTVDTCLMGLPTIAHFGPEDPAQSDATVLRTAGFPDWLVTKTDQEYLDLAVRLVNDAELRASVTQHLSREAIRARLYNYASDGDGDKVGEVFYKLYQNHERLATSDQRVYDYKDILALPV